MSSINHQDKSLQIYFNESFPPIMYLSRKFNILGSLNRILINIKLLSILHPIDSYIYIMSPSCIVYMKRVLMIDFLIWRPHIKIIINNNTQACDDWIKGSKKNGMKTNHYNILLRSFIALKSIVISISMILKSGWWFLLEWELIYSIYSLCIWTF